MLFCTLVSVGLCQPLEDKPLRQLEGFLQQTAITQESYLITDEKALKEFVDRIPPVLPYKTLPATPNPDPFLKDLKIDFEESIVVVAVGRDRIADRPVFKGLERAEGVRYVDFILPERTARTYPYGWAVYTALVLPRIDSETKIVVTGTPKPKTEDFPRAKFPRL